MENRSKRKSKQILAYKRIHTCTYPRNNCRGKNSTSIPGLRPSYRPINNSTKK